MVEGEHLCIKPSARQNRLPIGTTHLCRGCGTVWVVVEDDADELGWARLEGD